MGLDWEQEVDKKKTNDEWLEWLTEIQKLKLFKMEVCIGNG